MPSSGSEWDVVNGKGIDDHLVCVGPDPVLDEIAPYLKDRQARTEVAPINRELKRLKLPGTHLWASQHPLASSTPSIFKLNQTGTG